MFQHLPPDHYIAKRVRDNWALTLRSWEMHFEWAYFVQLFPSERRVLDFGSGTGHSSLFVSSVHRVIGYDIDPEAVRFANYIRSLQSENIQERIRFTNVLPPASEYDLIWSSHVFEHIPVANWPYELSRLRGQFLMSVPLGFAYDDPEHVNHWANASELSRDLVNSGAQITWVEEFPLSSVIRALVNL
jgi:SAM-dependent methyltransferase